MAVFKIVYKERNFGINETIEAVIRSMNKDENINGGLLSYLMTEFNKKNKNEVPRIGQAYKIPIIKRD